MTLRASKMMILEPFKSRSLSNFTSSHVAVGVGYSEHLPACGMQFIVCEPVDSG